MAALIALMLSVGGAVVKAEPQGCNSAGCWYSGYYIEWGWFGFYACSWWEIFYNDGTYVYQDCHSNYGGFY